MRSPGLTCAALAAALLLNGCAPTPRPPAFDPLPEQAGAAELLEFERLIVQLVNENRIVIRLPPLEVDPVLADLAREHSRDMASGRTDFGHDGFEERAQEAMAKIEVRHVGENVAMNNYRLSSSPQRTVQQWMGSPPHRLNIEGRFELTGVGVAQAADGHFYVTQLFALR